MTEQSGHTPLERFLRRSRWYVVALLGALYVFLPSGVGDALREILLVASVVYLWLPLILDTARGYRRGWRGDESGPTS
jgi:hypothetical protein